MLDVWKRQAATTVSRHTYTLAANGNRTQMVELLPQLGSIGATGPVTTTYGYDRLYRLTAVSQPGAGGSQTAETIRLSVISQFRTDVDARRQPAGLGPYPWTDPTLTTSPSDA